MNNVADLVPPSLTRIERVLSPPRPGFSFSHRVFLHHADVGAFIAMPNVVVVGGAAET
jgi:hypothetical protein